MKYKVLFIIGVLGLAALFIAVQKRNNDKEVLESPQFQVTQENISATVSPTTQVTSAPVSTSSNKITLNVSSPANGATVTSSSIKVSGKTTAGAEVFVNESETKADANGNFSVSVALDEGDNYIIVMVNDADGNVAEAELTVIYES